MKQLTQYFSEQSTQTWRQQDAHFTITVNIA